MLAALVQEAFKNYRCIDLIVIPRASIPPETSAKVSRWAFEFGACPQLSRRVLAVKSHSIYGVWIVLRTLYILRFCYEPYIRRVDMTKMIYVLITPLALTMSSLTSMGQHLAAPLLPSPSTLADGVPDSYLQSQMRDDFKSLAPQRSLSDWCSETLRSLCCCYSSIQTPLEDTLEHT